MACLQTMMLVAGHLLVCLHNENQQLSTLVGLFHTPVVKVTCLSWTNIRNATRLLLSIHLVKWFSSCVWLIFVYKQLFEKFPQHFSSP